jgi:hypothetical protein
MEKTKWTGVDGTELKVGDKVLVCYQPGFSFDAGQPEVQYTEPHLVFHVLGEWKGSIITEGNRVHVRRYDEDGDPVDDGYCEEQYLLKIRPEWTEGSLILHAKLIGLDVYEKE